MQPDKTLIEDRFRSGIQRWIEHGISCGGFLDAVIRNDLSGAVGRADSDALENIPHIVAYLYNCCPTGCWGSNERAEAWRAKFAVPAE
jgi:hypothetical protein